MSSNISKIHILGKSYSIGCLPDQVASLQKAALYLDEKCQALKRTHPQYGLEKIAITVALNLAHELTTVHEDDTESMRASAEKLTHLQKCITDTLTEQAEF